MQHDELRHAGQRMSDRRGTCSRRAQRGARGRWSNSTEAPRCSRRKPHGHSHSTAGRPCRSSARGGRVGGWSAEIPVLCRVCGSLQGTGLRPCSDAERPQDAAVPPRQAWADGTEAARRKVGVVGNTLGSHTAPRSGHCRAAGEDEMHAEHGECRAAVAAARLRCRTASVREHAEKVW